MIAFLLITLAVGALAAVSDYRTGLIPNQLTLGAIVVGIFGHGARGWYSAGWQAGLAEAGLALLGLLCCSLAPGFMYWKGGMGGGDLKLFAAIGALCQPLLGIEIQMYGLVVAALVAPARLAYEGKLFSVLSSTVAVAFNPLLPPARRRSLPAEALTPFRLGPAIFAGVVISLVLRSYAALPG
jgi:prepilin peptidase CpaA